ncbi:hypothetical protein RN001_007849 [Aquatica leii]|uniref:CRAL-TRIO domain-containing protein n=1 Tax=Aquatica leii TaxID=1421715 RepID=A0AAN7SP15_9COLE|nr:hypothetical protein RN001_007849 [Aquatica leii]
MSEGVITVQDFSGKILTESDINSRLEELISHILEDPKLKTFRTDHGFLLRFLHCAEFSIPLSLTKIRNYYNLVLEYPNWFAVQSPLEFKDKLEYNDKIILKERDRNGRSIFILKTGKIRTDNSCPQQEAQILELWMEYFADSFETQRHGVSAILDMKDYSWKLFRWLTPTNIKISAKKIDAYPIKDLVIHVVNTSFLLNASIKLIWPFFNDRLRHMFKFHYDSWESLHKYINPEHLPAEYGGTGSNLEFDKAIHRLIDKSDEIKVKLSKQKVIN